ncbi:MAG: DUF2192 domain-containing protein [Desulfurococcaceae archaeon]
MKGTPYGKRVRLAVSLLSDVLKDLENLDRAKVVEMLRREYARLRLSPIMGSASPQDIYDKEMATLYVVAKYGLRLDEDHPELFDRVFYIEEALEKALEHMLEGRSGEGAEILRRLSPSGTVDGNVVARLLRIPMTKYLLGFSSEEEFAKALKAVERAVPEEARTVGNFARFFVAFKLAESIARGEVRNRTYKEALKRALAFRIGFPKSTPSDRYVASIATRVFGVPKELCDELLGEGASRTQQGPQGQRGSGP